jgi:hypothetical protein
MGCFSPDIPEQPNPLTEARTAQAVDAELIPFRKAIDEAAVKGEKITVNGKTYDFTGLGESDYNRAYADAMANAALEVQRKYGADFIAQRQKELNIADPQGQQARKVQYAKILEELGRSADPDANAESLQASIMQELSQGGQLPNTVSHDVSQGVLGRQVARGNFLGNAAASQEAGALADASTQYKTDRQNRALAMLSSGSTPEDIAYRKAQQSMANLSSFMRGETPTTQFGQLSAASNGAAPFQGYQSQNYSNPNAIGQAMNYASQTYGVQMNQAAQQANPWLAGLSLGFQGLGAWGSLGGGKKV